MFRFKPRFHRDRLNTVTIVVVDDENVVITRGGWGDKFAGHVAVKFSGRLENGSANEVGAQIDGIRVGEKIVKCEVGELGLRGLDVFARLIHVAFEAGDRYGGYRLRERLVSPGSPVM